MTARAAAPADAPTVRGAARDLGRAGVSNARAWADWMGAWLGETDLRALAWWSAMILVLGFAAALLVVLTVLPALGAEGVQSATPTSVVARVGDSGAPEPADSAGLGAVAADAADANEPEQVAGGEAVADWMPLWAPQSVARWRNEIEAAAAAHGVDPALVAIIVLVESGGNPNAVSSSGALGLSQVVPRWHPTILDGPGGFDPAHNLDVGTAYLAECLRRYGVADDADWAASVDKAASCYNGGSTANVSAETTRYRRWVSGMWAERHDAESPTLDAWLAAGGGRLVDAAGVDQ